MLVGAEMLSPNELKRIVASAEEALRRDAGAALATVVSVVGSSYRRPGARMLVSEDGSTVGGVSGGCLEADVMHKARLAIAERRPVLLHYDTTDEDDGSFGAGLGCHGEIEILVEPLMRGRARLHIRRLREVLTTRRPLTLAVQFRGPADELGAIEEAEPASRSAFFVDHVEPIPRLFVVGAGPDIEPLAACAHALGYEVLIVDERPGYLRRRRLPYGVERVASSLARGDHWKPDAYTACLVATHDARYDARALEHLLATPAMYVGLIGPRKRAARLLEAIGGRVRDCGRLYSPAGLDIGGATPEQVALAILAEVEAVRNRRSGGSLRDRDGSIHDDESGEPLVDAHHA